LIVSHTTSKSKDLGNQDHVGGRRDPGVQRDPARVAAHNLDHHDPLVRLGRRVDPVDGLGGDHHRSVEAEGHHRAGEVVVDGLRNANDRKALVSEAGRDLHRAIAADGDEGIDAKPAERLEHLV
jgi:hypothetical protein